MDTSDRSKVGIKDVSREAGVALSTVSHVLNGTASISPEVRSRVLEAARRLGYLAKRQQKGSIASLSTVYLAVPPGNVPHVDTNLFSWTLLTALTRECEKRGVRVVAHSGGESLNAQEIIDGAKAVYADGIVLVYDDNPKLLRTLAASGIAVVLLNGEDPSMSVDTVTPGNRYAARLATEWLLSRGHQNILHLTWRGRGTITRRVDGFLDAYRERQLPAELGRVYIADGYKPSDGEAAVRLLLSEEGGLGGATALFCASDNLAVGALQALQAHGIRVPEDVAVVGFDGVALGDLTRPPLTTVRVPLQEMAVLALQALENRLSVYGPEHPPCRIELGCKLIERESARAI
ncbi:DNA-binding LacI/PurR family transcriptional regulator [Peteryoungia aggregata LMG 23059]|uniref:DNA-binding LacI/PurR family transcriptional regulator n=1 Tax=Peteryoungia aggregata LMG 23059 TaxID=1368425 RepID=A0ABU0G484_9HYPH|nr:LacI family DNA-binding transcriptional regulator [Peteryoungia aggregata]MDQ0419527.1 DNA-binding LacI/PurR family transcriptional regulator [Peteryoungia aggregata LMG 23059]